MVERFAVAVVAVVFAVTAWINPGEVLPFARKVILWCVVAFFAITLLIALPDIVTSTPRAFARMRYRSRFRQDIRHARRIISAHSKRLAADPASEHIGDLHNNPWHDVQTDFIRNTITPQLGKTAQMELDDWRSPLSDIVRQFVDDAVLSKRV